MPGQNQINKRGKMFSGGSVHLFSGCNAVFVADYWQRHLPEEPGGFPQVVHEPPACHHAPVTLLNTKRQS